MYHCRKCCCWSFHYCPITTNKLLYLLIYLFYLYLALIQGVTFTYFPSVSYFSSLLFTVRQVKTSITILLYAPYM